MNDEERTAARARENALAAAWTRRTRRRLIFDFTVLVIALTVVAVCIWLSVRS